MIGPTSYTYTNPYQGPWPVAQNGNAPPAAPSAKPAAQPAQRPVYYWSTPTDWMNSARTMGGAVKGELQKAFPGNYAHVIGWQPIKSTMINLRQTGQVLNDVSHHRPVKDHELISFDDNMKRAASLGIAGLATLGLKQRIFGVGEFLGLTSWFGAMALTPKVINGMARMKTGVNLNQSYDSTEGQRLNLYKDPNYLPLHILSEKDLDRAAKKLGIPDGPNRRREIEDKMRQISVQAHTWGMLIAGPATPVISGLTCDLLQDPATRGLNGVKRLFTRMEADRNLKLSHAGPKTMARKTKAYLEQVIGEVPESELSSWWKQFGQGIVKHTGLSAIETKTITKGTRIKQMDALVDHLAGLAEHKNPKLQSAIEFLNKQHLKVEVNQEEVISGRLQQIREKSEKFLDHFESALKKEDFLEQQRQMETRLLNAQSTVTHYRNLFAIIEKASPKNENEKLGEKAMAALKRDIRSQLGSPQYNVVQDLIASGHQDLAKKLVGNTDVYNAISRASQNGVRQYGEAAKLMGASPEKHLLDDALKSAKLGALWRTRMGLGIGGVILGATTLYNFTMVGRDFGNSQPPKKPTGGPG